MRLALVSLIAIAGLGPMAWAQTPATPAPQPAPQTVPAAPATAAPTTVAPMTAPPTTAPPMAAPGAATTPPVAAQPMAPSATPSPDTTAQPAAQPMAPPAPPPPPPPPTDPTAIALLSAVENICIPAVSGGNMAKLAKAAGYRKSGDNFVYKQPTFQFTVLPPGSNPTQCHIDIVHPIYPEGPARPLVIALHNWADIIRGWNLYQNTKTVDAGQEFSIRSWEHTVGGMRQALVITTIRKGDGTPTLKNADTSMVLYSMAKIAG